MGRLGLAVAALAMASCATIARWDAQLAYKRECARKQCHDRNRSLFVTRIYTGHEVFYCCERMAEECYAVDENDCEVTL